MKHALLTLVLFSFFLPVSASAEELNAGFVQGLWYSEKEFFADEPVRIYVALRNNTEYDLTATVRFRDNNETIGHKDVSALPGRLIEAWVDWTPRYGEHTIEATIINIWLHKVGQSPEIADVESALAKNLIFVDYDTDGDGIGNEKDTDDDGDGVTDRDEGANGTDPLDPSDPAPARSDGSSSERAGVSQSDDTTDEQGGQMASSGGAPQGLEQFLSESRAEHALAGITNVINESKDKLDAYRDRRNDVWASPHESASEETSGTDETSVDTPTTTREGDVKPEDTATITRSKIDTHGSGIAKLFSGFVEIVSTLLSVGYTFALFLLSTYLAHPALVQLSVLVLILFIVYKIARHFGQRTN